MKKIWRIPLDLCAIRELGLSDQINQITNQIKDLIATDKVFLIRFTVLKTAPGMGDIVTQNLLAFIPELGTLTRRQIDSLVRLAPRARDSGKFQGYRHTAHGRDSIKLFLFKKHSTKISLLEEKIKWSLLSRLCVNYYYRKC